MTVAIAVDKDKPRGISDLSTEPVLRQAATFFADLVKQGVPGAQGEGASDEVSGRLADFDVADGWAHLFYGSWVEGLSRWERSALEEYKREGFRGLNRGLRDHDGDLSMRTPA